MKLQADELNWIDERMNTYQIKYRNVHNEILDHVISAIEEKRQAGDAGDIETLFQQVVNEHLGGTRGIEKLVAKQGDIYKQSIKKIWLQSLLHYFTWPMLGLTIVVLLLSLKLPNVMQVKLSILIVCTLLACSPVVYAHFLLQGRVVKTINGSRRFLRIHLVIKAAMPAVFLFIPFRYLPHKYIYHLPPVIFMGAMMLFILLNLTAIHFCRQFTALEPTTR